MTPFAQRMIGAARLEPAIYEEVEHDPHALPQAVAVVVLSAVAAGIGASASSGAAGFVMGILGSVGGWVLWSCLSFFIGTRFMPEAHTRADWGELLRTTGFASAPGVLRVFGVVPILGWLIFALVALWLACDTIWSARQEPARLALTSPSAPPSAPPSWKGRDVRRARHATRR
jgi:hypothetical protein